MRTYSLPFHKEQYSVHYIFLLHINDLQSNVQYSKVQLFAYDCLLYKEIRTHQEQIDLQKNLSALESWDSTWGMRFNAKKFNILQVIRMGWKPLPQFYTLVSDAKYLGIQIDSTLDWSNHISSMVSRNLKGCPSKLRGTAHFSLVPPSLEYCCSVWQPNQNYNSDKIGKNSAESSKICL